MIARRPLPRLQRAAACTALAVAVHVLPIALHTAVGQNRTAEGRYDLVLRNVDVETALDKLVDATGISLLFDSEKIPNATVFCTGRDQTPEDILRCILSRTPLDFYQLSSGTYVVIERPIREPDRGILAGVVVDFDTGTPIADANVYIANSRGGVATNASGQFSLGPVVAGEYELVASHVGYLPYTDTLIVPANGARRRRIALRSAAISVTPVIVNGMQQRRLSASLGSGEVTPPEATGVNANLVRLATEIEGVRSGISSADLHIQGGQSGEHVVLLDGAPIFQPVTLGRILGSFSPLAIGKITVHKAGFEAPYGSRLSGVVAFEHDMADSRGERFSVLADPFSVNARVSLGNGSSPTSGHALVAVRRSLWGAYRVPAIESMLRAWNSSDPLLTATILSPSDGFGAATPHAHASDLSFTDMHVAARFPIDPFRSISVSGYRGQSDVATELLASEAIASNSGDAGTRFSLSSDRYRWSNTMAQVTHEWLVGARWLASARLRYSDHRLTDRFGLADSETLNLSGSVPEVERALRAILADSTGDDTANSYAESALELRSTFSVADDRQLDVGADVVAARHAFEQRSGFFRPVDLSGTNWRVVGFANYELRLSEGLRADVGSRLTYIPDRRTAYLEPRLALRYDATSELLPEYSVRLAGGLYRQYVNALDLSSVGPSAVMPFVRIWLPTDGTIGPATAYHAALETIAIPRDGWQLRLETYAKWLPSFYAIDYAAIIDASAPVALTDERSFVESGSGRTFGASARLERSGRHADVVASYAFERNMRRYASRVGEKEVVAPWSEPHRVSSQLRLRAGKGLSLRTRLQVVAGRSWGFRQAYYDFLAAHNSATAFPPYNLRDPESHRLPAIVQIDAGIGYERRIAAATARINLDVLNLTDWNQVADWSLRALADSGGTFAISERYLPGIQPMLAIEVSF
ncbi:MAG: TonB-dependent receptor [Rhodothermales bacterium]